MQKTYSKAGLEPQATWKPANRHMCEWSTLESPPIQGQILIVLILNQPVALLQGYCSSRLALSLSQSSRVCSRQLHWGQQLGSNIRVMARVGLDNRFKQIISQNWCELCGSMIYTLALQTQVLKNFSWNPYSMLKQFLCLEQIFQGKTKIFQEKFFCRLKFH